MVGVLAGDALLAPYETWDSARIKADLDARGGLVLFDYASPWVKEGKVMPKGRPTDDSDQTAALADSLIANRGLNEEDLFNRLRRIVFDHVSPLWEGKAFGAGKTTRNALRPFTYSESQQRPHDNEYPSNGSLMRSAPLALFFGSHAAYDPMVVQRMCKVTHRHGLAWIATCTYIRTLISLVASELVEEIEAHRRRLMEIQPVDPGRWPERGAAMLTLRIALWALSHATDVRDGLTKVALIGGDTDTYGAVAGGLLGATFGIEGIPQEWRDDLKGYEVMISLADQLYDSAHG